MKDNKEHMFSGEYGMGNNDTDTYDAKGLKCMNCKNKHWVIKVPKGITVNAFKLDGEYPVCGVKGMLRTPLYGSDL